LSCSCSSLFLLQSTPLTRTSTLSLHDALPISRLFLLRIVSSDQFLFSTLYFVLVHKNRDASFVLHILKNCLDKESADFFQSIKQDRKSTRLNSSHVSISYAVFCLKKKKKNDHS